MFFITFNGIFENSSNLISFIYLFISIIYLVKKDNLVKYELILWNK
jgi:hypothetical protein